MEDKNIRLWEELSSEEKRKIAAKRVKVHQEELLQMMRPPSPEAIDTFVKTMTKFAQSWNSLDFQASENMEEVNKAFYYTNIEPGYIPFVVSRIIKKMQEAEDLTKIIQIIVTKSKVSGNQKKQLEYISKEINSRLETIIEDCDFGCEWYEAGRPDIYAPEELTEWYNSDDFNDFITHLIVIEELKDYRERLTYPDEVLISQQSYSRRMEAKAQEEKQAIIDKISDWVNTILTDARVEPKRIVDVNRYVLSLLEEGEIPEDIKPINEYNHKFKSADFRTFIWVVWNYARDMKDIKKPSQLLITQFIHRLVPHAFQDVDSLNSIKQHLTDNISKNSRTASICDKIYKY